MASLALSVEKQRLLDETVYPLLGGQPELVSPECGHFEVCGGCQLQHLHYQNQLQFKREAVLRAFGDNGLQVGEILDPTVGMEDPWGYRNKADFNVKVFGGEAHLGFSRSDGRGLVEVEHCPIASAEINQVLQALRELMPHWTQIRRKLHSVIVRSSHLERKAAILYHTRLKDPETFRELTAQLMERCPDLKGASLVNRRKETQFGDARLRERILGIEYEYGLRSFFQANPVQTEKLVARVLKFAEPGPEDTVCDLFSGVGLFSLQFASHVKHVQAVEDTPAAVSDAKLNQERLGIENCTHLRGQVQEKLEVLEKMGIPISLVVLDPPRSGCREETLRQLVGFAPRRVIYVSCNPVTLARDAAILEQCGYRTNRVVPLDMFPQTTHVECVARFDRR